MKVWQRPLGIVMLVTRPHGAKRFAPGLVLIAIFAGCSTTSQTISQSDLPRLVLQESDVPSGFIPFDVGKQVGLDNEGTLRANPGRYGREGGWKARYHRIGTLHTYGPLVIESRADLFSTAGNAQHDVEDYRKQFQQMPGSGVHVVTSPRIGDGVVAVTLLQSPGLHATRFYFVAWWDTNVSASVTVNGADRHISLADAINLARKQERHIAATKR